jgi:hypothetical protein
LHVNELSSVVGVGLGVGVGVGVAVGGDRFWGWAWPQSGVAVGGNLENS